MNKSTLRFEFLVFIFSWLAGYFLTLYFGEGLAAVSGYALLVAWWSAIYCASIFDIKPRIAIYVAAFFFLIFMSVKFLNKDWFYRDVESLSLFSTIVIGLMQSVIVASPIIVNAAFRKLISLLRVEK
jgi:hypothetical protein